MARLIATSLTFVSEADTQVRESEPDLNYGQSLELMVDGEEEPHVQSFMRFTVTGVLGPIHSARLRVYATGNASKKAPAVYATNTSWSETGLTWDLRPPRIAGPLDDKDGIGENTWVEYDVTLFVTGNGTYSFVFAADSDDAVIFSSREGAHPPQLVVTLADGPTAIAGIPITGATSVPISGPSSSLTFTADMDARVREAKPNGNYGTSSRLQADNGSDPGVESYIRFTVTGITGQVLSAQLRLYAMSNATRNGPAVYASEISWTELGITWNTRPTRTGSPVDNQDRIRANRWVEYDVTSLIHGNGKQSFVLAADSDDAVNFSSREGIHPPELVVIFSVSPALTPYK